jgi:hypothetical protein
VLQTSEKCSSASAAQKEKEKGGGVQKSTSGTGKRPPVDHRKIDPPKAADGDNRRREVSSHSPVKRRENQGNKSSDREPQRRRRSRSPPGGVWRTPSREADDREGAEENKEKVVSVESEASKKDLWNEKKKKETDQRAEATPKNAAFSRPRKEEKDIKRGLDGRDIELPPQKSFSWGELMQSIDRKKNKTQYQPEKEAKEVPENPEIRAWNPKFIAERDVAQRKGDRFPQPRGSEDKRSPTSRPAAAGEQENKQWPLKQVSWREQALKDMRRLLLDLFGRSVVQCEEEGVERGDKEFGSISLGHLKGSFKKIYGYSLNTERMGFSDLSSLIAEEHSDICFQLEGSLIAGSVPRTRHKLLVPRNIEQ